VLFRAHDLDGIAAGRLTLAFRRWKRPTVKAGGGLNTRVGRLAIEAVDVVDLGAVTEAEAARAGYASLAELRAALPGDEPVHRIAFRLAGPDPRIAMRQDVDGLADLQAKVARMGEWAARTLRLIADHPGRRAGDLAPQLGWDTPKFKQQVRRLKALGLTESLEVGYRLSPRGEALLAKL
jgi:hypothetical protein